MVVHRRATPGCGALETDVQDRALGRINIVGRLEFAIVDLIGIKEGAEAVGSHNGASALLGQKPRAAEMVRMRMRDDDGVDPIQGDPGRVHSTPERLPRLFTREPWIDQGETVVILEGIRVDVA